MAKDIFGFTVEKGDGFIESGEGVLIGDSNPIKLLQQWRVDYQQQAQPIYECGTSTVYWAVKHGAGTLTCNTIVSSKYHDIKGTFGTVCEPKDIVVVAFSGQCKSSTGVRLVLKNTILTGVAFGGQAAQAYVTEDVTAQFVGIEMQVG